MSGPPPEDLEELLRRCHRDELLGLARSLKIKPRGMKLGSLAHAIDRTLRRRGGNDIANLVFRRGEGPPYDDVLSALASRMDVSSAGGVEATELALLQLAMERSFDQLDPAAREALWSRMHMEPPLPPSGEQAAVQAQLVLGRRFGYVAGSAVAYTALRMVPFVGCLAVALLARPRDDLLLPAVIEVSRLRQAVLHRVTVGVVGSPSSGKDAAIQAVFGLDGNVDPVAGSTREVEITRLPDATALFVVNTPGLGDVVESVTEDARQVLDHIDVYLYVVNAQGGVQARERDDYSACVASGRPVLAVVNKVDTLRDSDRERYLADARAKLGAAEEDFLAAAFDPLPQLSEEPIGVDAVRAWVRTHLEELGKDPTELPWV